MKKLGYFNILGNSFTGTVPSPFGDPETFTCLALRNNMLTGTFPSSIGLLTKITYIGVNDNYFTGTIPSSLGENKLNRFLCEYYYDNNPFLI
jgi:hypothetical protein